MQSTFVLELAHVWIITCWQSLRSDDIVLIVLCYRATDSKNKRQEQVWTLFVTLCELGSFFFSCWTLFSSTFPSKKQLESLNFPLPLLLGTTSQKSLPLPSKSLASFSFSLSSTPETLALLSVKPSNSGDDPRQPLLLQASTIIISSPTTGAKKISRGVSAGSVSYTHLTLPTKRIV